MYKITLYDMCCSPICDGVARFFVDDLDEFEKHWMKLEKDESVKERYNRSKNGENVTDYYSDDPELNIVQHCDNTKIIWEKEYCLEDKEYELFNFYDCSSVVYAKKSIINLRCISFNDNIHLIGKYRLEGVCEEDIFRKGGWRTCSVWGNPIFIVNVSEKERWIDAEGDIRLDYAKKDFSQDTIETYCWVDMNTYEMEEVTQSIEELSPEIIADLMKDIPGEAG